MEFDLQSEMMKIKERERKKATTLYNSDREQRGKK